VKVKNKEEAVAITLARQEPSFVLMSATGVQQEESGSCFVGFDKVYSRDELIRSIETRAPDLPAAFGASDTLLPALRDYPDSFLFVAKDGIGVGPFSPLAIYHLGKKDDVYNAAGEHIWAALPPGARVEVELTPAFSSAAAPPELEAITATLSAHGATWDIWEPSGRAFNSPLAGAQCFIAEVRNKQLAESLEAKLKAFSGAVKSAKPF
jgi:hypothetical protein